MSVVNLLHWEQQIHKQLQIWEGFLGGAGAFAFSDLNEPVKASD